jgi:hypothetical protein
MALQIVLAAPDEELQARCRTAEQTFQLARQAAAVGGAPTNPAASHYNPADQARRTAAYKELRAQDVADLEYLVWHLKCGSFLAECLL